MEKNFNIISILLLLVLVIACEMNSSNSMEKARKEILQAEADFDKMANEVGIKEAFIEFAADSAVLNRRGVVKGKKAISDFYDNNLAPNTSLTWKPEFVDVSSSGDLGYTYGPFTYTSFDSLGNKRETNGIFHTVWKKQKDGSWKYVYD